MKRALDTVTARIRERSKRSRERYLALVESQIRPGPRRRRLSEGNLAHTAASCPLEDKRAILGDTWPNIGIVTAYNDMLSAHSPFKTYPDQIKAAVRELTATAQVAGGVPAMCDGVTQGQTGMELSLLSRDTIALSSAVALSHDTFDAAIYLGVCDKIVPGQLIAALRFGWLPAIWAPAGPMPSGLSNPKKAKVRQQFATGEVGRDTLLAAEAASYHSPGTCTFYGTANTNQMLMELMGLQLPGASFVQPNDPLRSHLTRAAAHRAVEMTDIKGGYLPIARVWDERSLVNGLVGLMATGGSTNLAIHLCAIARAAGIVVDWTDFETISEAVPLLARVYPNGPSDVNHFHQAGGMAFLVRELLAHGLLHEDVETVAGQGIAHYAQAPALDDDTVVWRDGPLETQNADVLAPLGSAFRPDGGLRLLTGPVGRSVIKVSAVAEEHWVVEAPAVVIHDQHELAEMHRAGELERDFVCVLRFQGPRANGMPELHALSPVFGAQQDKGFRVALVTDGRLSGASGKFPAAIHMHPEALAGGPIAKIRTGDAVRVDARARTVDVLAPGWQERAPAAPPADASSAALGLGMFAPLRHLSTDAESGASFLGDMLFGDGGTAPAPASTEALAAR